MFGNTGDLGKGIGENIHRICHQNIDGIRCVLYDLGGDALENVYIGLSQLQTGLAGLTGHTGGDDDDIRTLSILIAAGTNDGRRAERSALVNIQCFAKSLFLIDINENDLAGNSLHHDIVGDGSTDTACANNSDLCRHDILPFYKLKGGGMFDIV